MIYHFLLAFPRIRSDNKWHFESTKSGSSSFTVSGNAHTRRNVQKNVGKAADDQYNDR
jgi:hypothetical protein